ncbi:MAG: cytochrome ubiquinol oxidase subunit I [Ponticaulis sp.]|nr:cytochrome ubiquinol oxidase subunit I [Ponticaulis sp.]|tara:strand:+ start:179796 stop:181214 length:1419 start_codon:yes stop_codon:yes gene_type:complete
MEFDALLLSRLQFAFVVAFHIMFPAFTIGLAAFLAVSEGLWLFTKKEVFKRLYLHWVKIFALAFAMGVVSGVVMSYQFGTNWSVFSDKAGSVIGPLLGYEVLTAFFLEATFLGVMLFGWKRVGPKLHFAATCAVAIGTSISAFWILSANSWMQTPQGFDIDPETGNLFATNFWEVIFNPSFPARYVHMMLAAFITTAAVVLAAGGYQVIRGRVSEPTRWQIRMASGTLLLLMPLQIWAGHWSGEIAHHYQPAKVAAIEGWWETADEQGTVLFGWPDENAEKTHFEIQIPGTSKFLFSAEGPLQGLEDFPDTERPPVTIVFWAFRIMVAAGLAMLVMGAWGTILWVTRRIDKPAIFHWLAVPTGTLGFIAVITGWIVAEVGRQPYTVYGVLRTEDSVSPVPVESVATSLLVFMVVYAIIFTAGVVYMARIATRGFGDDVTDPPPKENRAPGSAFGSVDDKAEQSGDVATDKES